MRLARLLQCYEESSRAGLVALPFLIGQIPNIKKGINGLMDLGSSADTGFGSVPGGTGPDSGRLSTILLRISRQPCLPQLLTLPSSLKVMD